MNPLWKLDEWLIHKAEQFCHWVQRETGKTNYFLAGVVDICLVGVIFAIVAGATVWNRPPADPYFLSQLIVRHPWFTGFLCLLFLCAGFWGWKYGESEAFKRLARGVANPEKIRRRDKIWRLLTLTIVTSYLPILGPSHDLSIFLLLLAWQLLIACDPLPPCRGKLWDRLARFFAQLAQAKSASAAK